jgi:hypothetical protein
MNNHLQSEILGWIGNAFLVVGMWQIGNRKRWAFILQAIGEIIWLYACYLLYSYSMMFICAVFTVIAIRNYVIDEPEPSVAPPEEKLIPIGEDDELVGISPTGVYCLVCIQKRYGRHWTLYDNGTYYCAKHKQGLVKHE